MYDDDRWKERGKEEGERKVHADEKTIEKIEPANHEERIEGRLKRVKSKTDAGATRDAQDTA